VVEYITNEKSPSKAALKIRLSELYALPQKEYL